MNPSDWSSDVCSSDLGDGKGQNIWDFWYQEAPEKFFQQVGPDKTSQFYKKHHKHQ